MAALPKKKKLLKDVAQVVTAKHFAFNYDKVCNFMSSEIKALNGKKKNNLQEDFKNRVFITKTHLFKYIENFTTKT